VNANESLLNATQLAKALGVSTWVTKGMKIAGTIYRDPPFIGGRYTTVSRAMAWLERHPDFVASHHLRSPGKASAA